MQCILLILNEQNTGGMKVVWMCVGISVALHVALAFASPQIISIFKPEIEKKEKKKKKKPEIVIALIPPTTPETVVTPPAPQPPKPPKPKQPKAITPPPMAKQASSQPKLPDLPKLQAQPNQQVKVPVKPKRKEPAVKLAPAHARTSDNQLAGIPEQTNLIGERDTLASSNAKVDPNAPNEASIKGEKSEFKEATNTSYQDGDLAHMNKGGTSAITPPTPPEKAQEQPETDPRKLADQTLKEAKSSIVESKDRGDAIEKIEKKLAVEASVLKNEVKQYLDTSDKSLNAATEASAQTDVKKKSDKPMDAQEAQEEKNTIANKKTDSDAPKQKAQEEKQRKKASKPKQASSNNAKKGFRSEAKAARYVGSISRRSKAGSRNVKASPLGKYMAKVSKTVEQEWQRRLTMKGDLIQPGTLRMRFIVHANGRISQVETLYRSYGSEISHGLTFQAIKSAKLPPMPAKVRSVQNGDPIEFIYTFAF